MCSRTKIKACCEHGNIINIHHLHQWETTEQQAIEKWLLTGSPMIWKHEHQPQQQKKWPASSGFNTLDNWGHKTPTQSKRKRTEKKRLCIQYTRLHKLIFFTTNPETYKQVYLQLITESPSSDFFFFLLMVQKERKGSLWHLSPLNVSINHLLVSLQMTALHLLQDHELFIWLWNMFTVPKKNHFWYCLILFCHYKLCIT